MTKPDRTVAVSPAAMSGRAVGPFGFAAAVAATSVRRAVRCSARWPAATRCLPLSRPLASAAAPSSFGLQRSPPRLFQLEFANSANALSAHDAAVALAKELRGRAADARPPLPRAKALEVGRLMAHRLLAAGAPANKAERRDADQEDFVPTEARVSHAFTPP